MFKNLTFTFLMILLTAGMALGGDLYKVEVGSHEDADALIATGADAAVRIGEGYLVLADNEAASRLAESGLHYQFLASNVSRENMAVDMRRDKANIDKYPILYQEGDLRIYRVDLSQLAESKRQLDLAPAAAADIKIEYKTSKPIDWTTVRAAVNLDSLIGLVSQDSIEAYEYRLQAFDGRVTGTDSNLASAGWISDKFSSFGYDSVYFDDFSTNIYGIPSIVRNVVATKIGTVYPNRYIIVGGHYDAVPDSPGADDNGSGTVGTLEIARILANIDTKMSFIFIAFSGEEQGLYGSYHYADNAAANGDTIIYMLNMDMIAHYENSNQANLFYGADNSYAILWQTLADSLVGISGVLAGSSGGSDHYPFAQNGYNVTFVHEFIFSTVYHSYQDSTSYMNFDYMTRMIKASLATVYTVLVDVTAPKLEFAYPNGAPEYLTPGLPTDVDIDIVPVNGGQVVSGSEYLFYSIDAAPEDSIALMSLGNNEYKAELPTVWCADNLTYYFKAEEVESGIFYDPSPTEPYAPQMASELYTNFEDNFDTDKGWTTENLGASSGSWQRGIPINDPEWDYDPITDADGGGACYLTQNTAGNTDIDGGAVRLTSPVFDMSQGTDGSVSYAYYLYLTNTAGGVDRLLVEMNDGTSGTWYQVALHDTDGSLTWRRHSISYVDMINAGLAMTPSMQIRFTANDADPQSIVEAGIDDFLATTFACTDPFTFICGDANADELLNIFDITYVIQFLYLEGPEPDPLDAADVNNDGTINIFDITYMIDYLYREGPEPTCP